MKILYTEMAARKPGLIALFDVDGTLTAPPKVVTSDMLKFMQELRKVVTVGVVGGSDLVKISEQLGNSVEFTNFTQHYIVDLDIPIKRGTFIAFQSGMLNVSPISRNYSHEKRDEFEKYDKVLNISPTMVSVLREKFAHLNLTFSIGGQISFDVFPQGWDKTYSLRYVDDFHEIHFFGDRTYKEMTMRCMNESEPWGTQLPALRILQSNVQLSS
ncbi:unnamed protein product [Camellia sinensis]